LDLEFRFPRRDAAQHSVVLVVTVVEEGDVASRAKPQGPQVTNLWAGEMDQASSQAFRGD